MIERLRKIKEKYEELTKDLVNPDILADMSVWQKKSKEQSELTPIVEKYDEYVKVNNDMNDAEEMLKTEKDADMVAMLEAEFYGGKEKLKTIEEELKILLLPKDENDEGNVIIEIRAGVGGDEAGIFAGDLYRMYTMFADRNRFKVEVLDEESAEGGIIKQVNFMVTGKGAYAKFKYESGVHRVQRVPVTESSGRIHTSAATVAVLPEAKNVQIEINEKDLQIDYYRAGGAGGQHVNKTESAIRITHLPTGITAFCHPVGRYHPLCGPVLPHQKIQKAPNRLDRCFCSDRCGVPVCGINADLRLSKAESRFFIHKIPVEVRRIFPYNIYCINLWKRRNCAWNWMSFLYAVSIRAKSWLRLIPVPKHSPIFWNYSGSRDNMSVTQRTSWMCFSSPSTKMPSPWYWTAPTIITAKQWSPKGWTWRWRKTKAREKPWRRTVNKMIACHLHSFWRAQNCRRAVCLCAANQQRSRALYWFAGDAASRSSLQRKKPLERCSAAASSPSCWETVQRLPFPKPSPSKRARLPMWRNICVSLSMARTFFLWFTRRTDSRTCLSRPFVLQKRSPVRLARACWRICRQRWEMWSWLQHLWGRKTSINAAVPFQIRATMTRKWKNQRKTKRKNERSQRKKAWASSARSCCLFAFVLS